LGALNPLETIRKYIADRHERTKDREYRNDLNLQERQLEIERRRIEVVRDKVDLLQSVGVPGADSKGGCAARITASRSTRSHPRFTPDLDD